MQLEDLSSLELDVNVPEQDFVLKTRDLTLAQRTERARPEIEVSTIPGRRFPARLVSFETAADPATRTYRATFAFDSPSDVNVLPGMTAKVILNLPGSERTVEKESGPLIPVTAVVTDSNNRAYVWRYDSSSSVVNKVEVTIGDMSEGSIFVTSGIESGDTIAAAGAAHLREGMKVRPLGN